MIAVESSGEWTQEGAFPDSDGVLVRAYDDVALTRAIAVEGGVRTNLAAVPAGTVGTILFFQPGPPAKAQLELSAGPDAFTFGFEELDRLRLYRRGDDKRANDSGRGEP